MAGSVDLTLDGAVAMVCLRRAEKLNALDGAMFAALSAIMVELAERADVRAVVLHGEGRAFCAGLDLAAMRAGGLGLDLAARDHGIANAVQHVAWGWRTLSVPVIAAVHGVAFGAGLQIMSGADIRIGAPDMRLSIREIAWGLIPDMGGMALWRTLVRDDRLRELTYTAREFDGIEAERSGFLTRVSGRPLDDAVALAQQIAGRSPDAIVAAKRLINLAADADAAEMLWQESVEQLALKGTPNQREAVAAIVERRPPHFGPAER